MVKLKIKRQCYARDLGGCDGGISDEHVLSESVIDEDFPMYFRDQRKDIDLHTSAVTIPVLCKKHNRDLSPYDTEGGRFIRAMRHFLLDHEVNNLDVEDNGTTKLVRINGPNLEKWFAKTLLNLSVYKAARGSFTRPVHNVNYDSIVRYLFEDEPLDDRYGLFQLRFGTHLLPPETFSRIQVTEHKYYLGSKAEGIEKGPFSVPGLLYVFINGIELVGNFNVSMFKNIIRDDMTLGEDYKKFPQMKTATKHPESLIFAPLDSDVGKLDPLNPPFKIVLEW